MSIVSRNQKISSQNLSSANTSGVASLKKGLNSALSGGDNAIYNHTGQWNGYRRGVPTVRLYGEVYDLNAVHGYKGIPKYSTVVVRAAQGFMAADFQ